MKRPLETKQPDTPLDDLRRLVNEGMTSATLGRCRALAQMLFNELRIGLPVNRELDGRIIKLLRGLITDAVVEARPVALKKATKNDNAVEKVVAAVGELLAIPEPSGRDTFGSLLKVRGINEHVWRNIESNLQPKQRRQIRGGPWLRQQDRYAYKALEKHEAEYLEDFLSYLKVYAVDKANDLRPILGDIASTEKFDNHQEPLKEEVVGPSVGADPLAAVDKPPSPDDQLHRPGSRPSLSFRLTKTKVGVFSVVLALLVSAGLFALADFGPFGRSNATPTLDEVCGYTNAPLTADISEVSELPTWWATAKKLPGDLLAKLNAKDQPDQTIDQLLQPYEPIKQAYPDGSRHRLILVGRCKQPVVVKKIQSKIISKSAPLAGGFVLLPSQGDVDVKSAAVNLDAPSGTDALEYDSKTGRVKGNFLGGKVTDITEGEVYPIDLYGQTKRYTADWAITIEVLVDNRSINLEVLLPDHKPLRSTALVEKYESAFVLSTTTFMWEVDKGKLS